MTLTSRHRWVTCPSPQTRPHPPPPGQSAKLRLCRRGPGWPVFSLLSQVHSWTWRSQVPHRAHHLSCHSSRPGRGVPGVPQPGLALCSQWWGKPAANQMLQDWYILRSQLHSSHQLFPAQGWLGSPQPRRHDPQNEASRNGEAQAMGQGLWARLLLPASTRAGLVGYYFSQAS